MTPNGRTVGDWQRAAQGRLCQIQPFADAAREARLILQAATGWSAARTATATPDDLPVAAEVMANAMLERRLAFEPLSHILGHAPFYGRTFKVSRDVLTPRPDTETLIDLALQVPFETVLDLGTGSGAIAITLLSERQGARAIATDIMDAAIAVARDNAQRLGVADRLELQNANWIPTDAGLFDLIVSNPPYISETDLTGLDPSVRDWEPRVALSPGGDGLGAYRVICRQAPHHLRPEGHLMVEIGHDQGAAVAALLREAGFAEVAVHGDLNGKDRVVTGRLVRTETE